MIDDEVEKMLSMGAIEKSQHEDNEFISNIFLIKKKNGKFRPVINLKKLNKFVEYHHFKMETLQHVAELLQRYCIILNLFGKVHYMNLLVFLLVCKVLQEFLQK